LPGRAPGLVAVVVGVAGPVDAILPGGALDPLAEIGADPVHRVTFSTLGTHDAGAERHAAALGAVLTLATRVVFAAGGRTFTGADQVVVTQRVALVEGAVTVIVHAVAALACRRATDAARVADALVDGAVAVVVHQVADLLGGARLGTAHHVAAGATVERPLGALSGQAGGALGGVHDGAPIGVGVHQVVAVVVDPITHLRVAVGHAEVPVAGVTDGVAVAVDLAPIDHLGAVVTGVAHAIPVLVCLVRVGEVCAVVVEAAEAVIVGVEADAAEGPL
jgi:hypothetical protein